MSNQSQSKSRIIYTVDEDLASKHIEGYLKEYDIDKIPHPDYFELRSSGGASIGIKNTKELQNWAQLKPFSAKGKIGVIFEAQLLTQEAQNSMLKLLEEPPEQTILILVTDNYKRLLPTIISRCELIELGGERKINKEKKGKYDNFISLGIIDKFLIVDMILNIKDKPKQKEEIDVFLRSLLEFYRKQLFHNIDRQNAMRNIEFIQQTNVKLSKNTSKRLVLEDLVINLD